MNRDLAHLGHMIDINELVKDRANNIRLVLYGNQKIKSNMLLFRMWTEPHQFFLDLKVEIRLCLGYIKS